MLRQLLHASLLSSLLGTNGCNDPIGCLPAECVDNFAILLEAQQGSDGEGIALPPGEYELELFLDGAPHLYSGSVPSERGLSCDDEALLVGVTDPRQTGGIITSLWVSVSQTPQRVHVIVRHQGTVLADHDISLASEPFAEDFCGAPCQGAAHQLPLELPPP